MSAADTRNAIAAAANTVDKIKVKPYFRSSIAPGDGMVRMERMTRDLSGFGFMTTWQVLIALPADIQAAEVYLESKIDALLDALGEVLVVTGVRQFELAVKDAGTVPVVVIEGNRASD